MQRNIHDVIDSVIREIPDDFEHRQNLKEALKMIKQQAYYVAPECIGIQWTKLINTLQNALGDLDSEWKKKIKSIVTGETNENSK